MCAWCAEVTVWNQLAPSPQRSGAFVSIKTRNLLAILSKKRKGMEKHLKKNKIEKVALQNLIYPHAALVGICLRIAAWSIRDTRGSRKAERSGCFLPLLGDMQRRGNCFLWLVECLRHQQPLNKSLPGEPLDLHVTRFHLCKITEQWVIWPFWSFR